MCEKKKLTLKGMHLVFITNLHRQPERCIK